MLELQSLLHQRGRRRQNKYSSETRICKSAVPLRSDRRLIIG